jgi:hypothetical protein
MPRHSRFKIGKLYVNPRAGRAKHSICFWHWEDRGYSRAHDIEREVWFNKIPVLYLGETKFSHFDTWLFKDVFVYSYKTWSN